MKMRLQPGSKLSEQPVWMRLIAMLCLGLVFVASTAQACHMHVGDSSAAKDSRQNSSTPDHCPLCVAMHSAMPAATQTAHDTAEVAEHLTVPATVERLGTIRVFDLQTRPPPVA